MSSAFPRRFLHLWFDRLPTDRVRLPSIEGSSTSPLALTSKVKGASRLQAVDEAAEAQGLHIGMTLSDARALVPELRVQEADPGADQILLQRIAQVCRRYSPALALAAPDGLDLDVTGVAELFGDEVRLLAQIRSCLQVIGLHMKYGLADTVGLAWAVARYGVSSIVARGEGQDLLFGLPTAALKLDPDAIQGLNRLGLKRIGQLIDLPRDTLTRRFGEDLLRRLDQALGVQASPLDLDLEIPPYWVEQRLAEPIALEASVLHYINELASNLSARLEGRGLGARRFVLELFRVDGAVQLLDVCASQPLRDAKRITALFSERLAGLNEGLEADFGFDLLRLRAAGVEPWTPQPMHLIGKPSPTTAFADLVDRIAARSGVQVVRLAPCDVHQPEQATTAVPFIVATNTGEKPTSGKRARTWADEPSFSFDGVPLRPIRLFETPHPIEVSAAEIPEGAPAQFRWRRVLRRVVRDEGPERIEPEWGREGSQHAIRDYFRLEDQDGRRYWVYRQGVYSRSRPDGAATPRWFLHGLFG